MGLTRQPAVSTLCGGCWAETAVPGGIGDDGLGLRGILETFALADVLRLLAATRKTGCLAIEGDGARGRVWVREGTLVEAAIEGPQLGEPNPTEVIFRLLRLERGSFWFVVEQAPASSDEPCEDVEPVVLRAERLVEEWRELTVVVPSLQHRVAMAPGLAGDHVVLDAGRWKALVAIADGPSLADAAATLGLGEMEVYRTMVDLVDVGVAVVEPPSALGARGPIGEHPAPLEPPGQAESPMIDGPASVSLTGTLPGHPPSEQVPSMDTGQTRWQ
jgi:uncharacterized protein DUF4388